MDKRYIGSGEVAAMFGVSLRTVLNWINNGKIKPEHRTTGGKYGKYRFDAAEVEKLLKSLSAKGNK